MVDASTPWAHSAAVSMSDRLVSLAGYRLAPAPPYGWHRPSCPQLRSMLASVVEKTTNQERFTQAVACLRHLRNDRVDYERYLWLVARAFSIEPSRTLETAAWCLTSDVDAGILVAATLNLAADQARGAMFTETIPECAQEFSTLTSSAWHIVRSWAGDWFDHPGVALNVFKASRGRPQEAVALMPYLLAELAVNDRNWRAAAAALEAVGPTWGGPVQAVAWACEQIAGNAEATSPLQAVWPLGHVLVESAVPHLSDLSEVIQVLPHLAGNTKLSSPGVLYGAADSAGVDWQSINQLFVAVLADVRSTKEAGEHALFGGPEPSQDVGRFVCQERYSQATKSAKVRFLS